MAMKQHMEEIHNTKEQAETAGVLWKTFYGYEWTVEESDGKWKLILTTNQVMMG